MAGKITWDDVVNGNFVGGDIESQEDGDVYRGPIKEIKKVDDSIVFSSEWMAKTSDSGVSWEKWHITEMSVSEKNMTPNDIGNGRVSFGAPLIGFTVLFPKGGSKLDPAKVKGLKSSFEWNKEQLTKIENCAKENGVLEIDLPEDEWKRLKTEEMVSLKPLLSENAFGRLILLDDHDRHYILVAHIGSCVH